KGSGLAVSKAEIKSGGQIYFTDPSGRVEIPKPTEAFTVSKYGLRSETLLPNDLSANEPTELFMYPGTPSDDEVIVRGKRRPEVSRKTISIEESKRIAPGGD